MPSESLRWALMVLRHLSWKPPRSHFYPPAAVTGSTCCLFWSLHCHLSQTMPCWISAALTPPPLTSLQMSLQHLPTLQRSASSLTSWLWEELPNSTASLAVFGKYTKSFIHLMNLFEHYFRQFITVLLLQTKCWKGKCQMNRKTHMKPSVRIFLFFFFFFDVRHVFLHYIQCLDTSVDVLFLS